MNNPSISVIIPIYNVEKYVSQCIESIIHQTYMPVEVLLINDGSKDGSLLICREYEKKYSNIIKVIDKLNGGLSSARNAGIINAKGKYCYFVDGDDFVNENTLYHFVNILQEYGDLDFIHGRMSYFHEGDNLSDLRAQPYYLDNRWAGGISDGQTAFCNAYRNQGMLQMGVRGVYRRDFLIKNNLFFVEKKISWGEDQEWTVRLFLFAKRCAGSDMPDYYYRENREGSETSKFCNINTAITMIDVYNGWLKLLDSYKCTNDFKNELRKESGRRFIICIVINSVSLSRDDFRKFLNYADKDNRLVTYAVPKGKMRIVKSLFMFIGIKNSCRLIRIAIKCKHKVIMCIFHLCRRLHTTV